MTHIDYSTMYVSTVDEVEPGEKYGYNVQIIRLKSNDGSIVCETCGVNKAEYVQDATEDLGIASCNLNICQACMDWSFNNTAQTGDVFQMKN